MEKPLFKSPPPPPQPPISARERKLRNIRWLIYLYLVLLVMEGALRKWVFPQFSNPLLIIRDPVVVLVYILALRARVSPRNAFVLTLLIISALSVIAGLLVLQPYLPPSVLVLVIGYGFRCNFLHLPLIFVMAQVFDVEDVKRIGRWILLGMVPMAILMAMQFRASPEAAINRAVGLGEGEQITAGGGKIRPPGTFSFVSGVIFYLAAAAAFLLHGALGKTAVKNWLLFAAGFAVVVGVAVSGSRSAVASVGLVVLSLVVILVVRPSAVNQFGRNLLIVAILAWTMTYVPIFKEGLGILSNRFTETAEASESTIAGGMIARVFTGFVEGFQVIDRLPLFGYGLGIGTNGGARFITGRAAFLLAEGEWSRVLLESGPILGTVFLAWRLILTVRLGHLSLRRLSRGETLPTILFSAGFVALLNGQFGQPTSLGFAVALNGLCLASMNSVTDKVSPPRPTVASSQRPQPLVPSRSAYAARLHDPAGGSATQLNGALDR